MLVIGLIVAIAAGAGIGGAGGAFVALLILVLFAIPIIRALIRYVTTEFAVTTRRVIIKMGFIRRVTAELNHRQVEGLLLSQGIIDRMFNAGSITVNGTGGRGYKVHYISNPMEFRRNALETIDAGS